MKIRSWMRNIRENIDQMKELIRVFSQTFHRSSRSGECCDNQLGCLFIVWIITLFSQLCRKVWKQCVTKICRSAKKWVVQFLFLMSNEVADSKLFRRCIHKWKDWKLIYQNRTMVQSWHASNVCTSTLCERNFSMCGKITNNFCWYTRNAWRRHCYVKRESVSARWRLLHLCDDCVVNSSIPFLSQSRSQHYRRGDRSIDCKQHNINICGKRESIDCCRASKIKLRNFQFSRRYWSMRPPNGISYVSFVNVTQSSRKSNDRLQKCVICFSAYRHWLWSRYVDTVPFRNRTTSSEVSSS